MGGVRGGDYTGEYGNRFQSFLMQLNCTMLNLLKSETFSPEVEETPTHPDPGPVEPKGIRSLQVCPRSEPGRYGSAAIKTYTQLKPDQEGSLEPLEWRPPEREKGVTLVASC